MTPPALPPTAAERYDLLDPEDPARTDTKVAFIRGHLAAMDDCRRWMKTLDGYRPRHQGATPMKFSTALGLSLALLLLAGLAAVVISR